MPGRCIPCVSHLPFHSRFLQNKPISIRGTHLDRQHQLDQLLDAWEDQRELNPMLLLTEFVDQWPDAVDAEVLTRFKSKAAALAKFDERVIDVVGPRHSPSQPQSNDGNASPTVGDHPIEGYVLVSRLGQGGFGEVWRATGPGGFDVALKFVRIGGRLGDSELRALETMKGVRHPHLLSMFGTWQNADTLIIASELADRTLLDRFDEARKQGHAGIPINELLRYTQEAAEGIDALNDPGSSGRLRIQHRDIKPQNLLLSGGSVKVGDFGLARHLQYDMTGHTGSLTMGYAAPECFDGNTSQHSDQYSLAITFCQLVGGKLPFDGSYVEVMNGHRSKTPDLSSVPKPYQHAVLRALAKKPKDRWASCGDFAAALIAASTRDVAGNPAVARRFSYSWSNLVALAGTLMLAIVGLSFWQIGSTKLPDGLPAASSRRVIAVLDFENLSNDREELRPLSKGLCAMVTTGLRSKSDYQLVERDRLQDILKELKLNRADSFDQNQVADIGRLLGAEQLVLGSYFELQSVFRLDARIVDVETGITEQAVGVEGRAEDFSILVSQLVEKLASQNTTAIVSQPKTSPSIPTDAAVRLGKAVDAHDAGDFRAAIKAITALCRDHPEFIQAQEFAKKWDILDATNSEGQDQ